jgi:aerobic-type carbon monoxide dehydrogenase small subunit (CoxS/CutS family)
MKPQNEMLITLKVNGEMVSERVDVRTHLVDFLREKLQLKGSHLGCEHGVCGACTVMRMLGACRSSRWFECRDH